MEKKKVLIICPHPSRQGGVADYYRLVRKYFGSDRVTLDYFYLDGESERDTVRNGLFRRVRDLVLLAGAFPRHDLIVFNPSLDARAVIRDGIFNLVAKRVFRRRTLVLMHGWDRGFERFVASRWKGPFRFLFNCDMMLVLAGEFREILMGWGFPPGRVGLETTICEQHEAGTDRDIFKIVFLSRFARNKGCLESIRTVEILAREFPRVKLYMVGDGELFQDLRAYVEGHGLGGNVEFTGWLGGKEKYDVLGRCGVMLFPTTFGEGMPISVIEGMGMGLAVVTRPVGGIRDIFTDGENGFLIDSTDPSDFAAVVRFLFRNREVWERISENNRLKAKERFEAGSAVKRIERLYAELAR